ncbi:beta-defensin-like 2 [Eucyclogobius newberryi]|uniref:beta-defensin-like 2 n=1 Tax=Eucyclogobius newberryi TaxID=166745 RepID=UPI003B597421
MQPQPASSSDRCMLPKMKGLSFVLLVLLLMMPDGDGINPRMPRWFCKYKGVCRRSPCYAQEYSRGHHGCPRGFRCCAIQ